MTRTERQKKIDIIYKSCSQEDKNYIVDEINKWCKSCDNYHKNRYTPQILNVLARRAYLCLSADNVKCNNKIKTNTLAKKDFLHNQILQGIFRRLAEAKYLINQKQPVFNI